MAAVKARSPPEPTGPGRPVDGCSTAPVSLFITDGYAATTMERIAEDAGVAVQTLYYTFGTKGQLLCEVVEVTAAGEEDAVPVPSAPGCRRCWPPPQASGSWHSRWSTAPTSSCGPLRSGRPSPRPLQTPTSSSTGERWPPAGAPARPGWWLGWPSWARSDTGSTPDRATDIVVTLFGHDVFRSLVTEAGWGVPEYKAWLLTTLAQQLLQRARLTKRPSRTCPTQSHYQRDRAAPICALASQRSPMSQHTADDDPTPSK